MLIVDLRRLELAPVEVRGAISADDPLWENTGVELATPLAVQATAEGSSARGVWVRGSFLGRVRTQCRRCLEAVEVEIADEVALFFDPVATAVDEDVTLYALDPNAEELDLRAPVTELFILAVPDFPVCREACEGLCPTCGANLNETECGCDPADRDPRWGPLRGLRTVD